MADKISFDFDSQISQTDKDYIQKSLQNITTNSPTFNNWLNSLKGSGVTNIVFGTRKVDDMSGIISPGSDDFAHGGSGDDTLVESLLYITCGDAFCETIHRNIL